MEVKDYRPLLDIKDTELAIKLCKDTFERRLSEVLHLMRVSAPLFLLPETGLNDNLSGVERPVDFDILETGKRAEVVQSLAKWKRHALSRYGFEPGTGLYTDMNAIRRDELADAIHSLYVDQWDWEKIITREQRTEYTLQHAVRRIYRAILDTAQVMTQAFPQLGSYDLPEQIEFITSQELEDLYPDLTSKQREQTHTRKAGALFIMQIGGKLKSGAAHDLRAPDYDDWSLNGDILIYHPVLDIAMEISSMGIRVDEAVLRHQLALSGCEDRAGLPFHTELLAGKLPQSMGGGIGQSRLCMFYLKKAHIGEVQASVWPQHVIEYCEHAGIPLL